MIKILLAWLSVGAVLGLIGTKFGPGIVMLIVAAASAIIGMVTTIFFKTLQREDASGQIFVTALGLGVLIASPWWIGMNSTSIVILGLVHLLISFFGSLLCGVKMAA